jgi:hypothetical protein
MKALLSALAISLSACGPEKEDPEEPAVEPSEPAAEDTGPEDPSPFTVEVNGEENLTLVFDLPDCSSPLGSSNLRTFWRSGSGEHVFVLVAEVLGSYAGEGSYSSDSLTVRTKLQEEAGGQARYFATDTAQGDSALVVIDSADDTNAIGEATAATMHSTTGSIAITPSSFPIYCLDISH